MGTMLGGVLIPDAGLEAPDSPSPEWQGGVVAVTRRYYVPTSALAAFLTGLSTSDTDPIWTDAKLVGASVAMAGSTNRVKMVELRYEPDSWTFTITGPVGSVTREADANPMEVPVAKAPGSPSESEIEAAIADGIEATLVPMPVYRRTEVKSSFTWNESNIIGNVGKIDDSPEGMTSPTAGAWLQNEHRVTEQSGVVTETFGWQYNPTGWDTTLYDSVA